MPSYGHSLLRQQIAFSRLHLQDLDTSASVAKTRAVIQASLLSAHLGVLLYLREVLHVAIKDLSELRQQLINGDGDYKANEVLALIDDPESWLNALREYVDTMQAPPALTQKSISSAIIASSGSRAHWTGANEDGLRRIFDAMEEMLERHSAHDEEY